MIPQLTWPKHEKIKKRPFLPLSNPVETRNHISSPVKDFSAVGDPANALLAGMFPFSVLSQLCEALEDHNVAAAWTVLAGVTGEAAVTVQVTVKRRVRLKGLGTTGTWDKVPPTVGHG